jgi:hypothetical protein
MYRPVCSYTHLLCFSSTVWQSWIMLLSWVYKYLFEILFLIFLGMCPEVKWLDDIVILFLSFWGAIILFYIAPECFIFLSTVNKGFSFFIFSPVLVVCLHSFKNIFNEARHGACLQSQLPGRQRYDCASSASWAKS